MEPNNLIELAERFASVDPTKNLKTALAEALQMQNVMHANVLVAAFNAQHDWDAEEALLRAKAELQRLGRQLEFAHTLAQRRNRLRGAAIPHFADGKL